MPSGKLHLFQVTVDEAMGQLVEATSERRISIYLQKLKERAEPIEKLEGEDYEQQAVEEDNLPWQLLAHRVNKALRAGEDRLDDLKNKA